MQIMLDKVRLALRITHDRLDSELLDLINACIYDLTIAGINKIDESDPLIQQVVKTYCKAEYEEDVQKANRLNQAYVSLKIALCLSGEYTAGGD